MPASDHFFYRLKTLHVVFALSSVAFFLSTLWMLAADHSDEWRDVQTVHYEIRSRRLHKKLTDMEIEHKSDVDRLQKDIESADEELENNQTVPSLRKDIEQLELGIDLASRAVRENRAELGVARADYDLAIRDNRSQKTLDDLKRKFDDWQERVDKLEDDQQKKETDLKAKRKKLDKLTTNRDKKLAELKKLQAKLQLVNGQLQKVDPDSWFSSAKRKIMEWPIIDGFNSPHKIVQDWLPDLKITLGMARTARFDRCRTCHMAIDQVERDGSPAYPFGVTDKATAAGWVDSNKFPHPYATHPNPTLYAAASSPHPATKFGCTICHDGNGAGTSFQNAEHAPNDPHLGQDWHEKYQYRRNHFWAYPMQPERFIESSCIKCHHSVVELGVHPQYGATAPKVYKGYQLITRYGCFGCHQMHGYTAGEPIGPDLRLRPATPEEAAKIAADPALVAGKMQKVGPALTHIAAKTTQEWVQYWTYEPKRFRPTTRMPQFFNRTNQQDADAKAFQPVELAGIAQYLFDKSTPIELKQPADGYEPDADRGRALFSGKWPRQAIAKGASPKTFGCLACHSHEAFPEITADFGPNLSQVHAKIKPGRQGFQWLYTWILEPRRHYPATKMPNLHLTPYEEVVKQDGKEMKRVVDPAADIAAFLLEKGPGPYNSPQPEEFLKVDGSDLDALVYVYLRKALTKQRAREVLETRKYPYRRDLVRGDEIELAAESGNAEISDAQWRRMKLNYVGRRTMSRYGCYGCHDIPGFETARPIGTQLQDWGRKDTSKLALEHIEEYLHHHGEPDGSSTRERVHDAMKRARAGGAEAGEFKDKVEQEREMSAAFFYDSLLHHGRPGFIWQKLRQPRSFDYMKTETKEYDERLRMPKFPFTEEEIEAIATFVLGLVAEPPAEQYLYRPQGPEADRIEGERLIEKYNCGGCHVLDLPEITYGVDEDDLLAGGLAAGEHEAGLKLLLKLKPPRQGETGSTMKVEADGENTELPVISFHGLVFGRPDPEDDPEDQEFAYDLWETLQVGQTRLLPGTRVLVLKTMLAGGKSRPDGYAMPARGGTFAEWLVESLMKSTTEGNRAMAWQMAPPPLYQEGIKVQTPWLYRFLQDPVRLRHTTVLRMPRFNMSPQEARSLANYFAAVDGAPYPYQRVPQRDPEYLSTKPADYLSMSWKLLNAPLCIKCHSLGGRQYQTSDPQKDIRGPDLQHVADRLRPDWTLLWLYKPSWITPYTSMPSPLPKNQKQFEELFGGDAGKQTIAIRDVLMNYHRAMEQMGKTVYGPKKAAPTGAAAGN